MIATTFGRHSNDHDSFYSWSPSKFMVEYGWGGRTIDPRTGRREYHARPEPVGPRSQLAVAGTARRGARPSHRQRREGLPLPLNVMEGNYMQARDVCPWWDATAARKTG